MAQPVLRRGMNEQEQAALRERYRRVCARLEDAARAGGRDPGEVTLVAVSKFHDAAAIRVVAACGQRRFGENYVREAKDKQAALADLDLEWHAIGHVQTNKAKDAAGHFALIHTVDSPRLAEALSGRLPEGKAPQPVLIQINIGAEPQKAGIAPDALFALAETVEILRRTWHVESRSVRPDHRMVAHTGFLTSARVLSRRAEGQERKEPTVEEEEKRISPAR
jgi:pyridoxal phosphate enzyme (YggS family)